MSVADLSTPRLELELELTMDELQTLARSIRAEHGDQEDPELLLYLEMREETALEELDAIRDELARRYQVEPRG
jgi:hypothetical protein